VTGGTVTSPADDPKEQVEEKGVGETSRPDWAARLIRALSVAMDDAGVRWLVLRNHGDLPDRVGHDVDILVHPGDAPKVDALVRRVVEQSQLFVLRTYRGIEHHSFDVASADLDGRLLLHLDFQTAARYRGRLLVGADDLLADRRRFADLWVPAPGMEAYALVLHTALHKGELKSKYADRLVSIEAAEPGALERAARAQLGQAFARRLAGVHTEPRLLALRSELGRAIDRRHPGNLWRRPWFNVRSGWAMTRLRLRPRGLFVVFLGPDGAGKSSTTDMLTQMLGGQSVLPIHRVYLGSGTPLLPTRKFMRWVHGKTGRRVDNRQRLRDLSPRRFRGALHVMTDGILRYWAQVWPRLSPHGVVIADRYAYDVLRVNNDAVRSPWFRRLATTIIPEPDITFFLEGEPEVIAARKQELTVRETVRQQTAYRDLAEFLPSFRPLDLSVRDEAALRRVAMEILRAYAARNGGCPRIDPPV
jgi:thymidylate kinase